MNTMRFLLTTLFLCAATPAFAGKAEDIKRVEAYLTNLTTISAEFMQTEPSGAIAGGRFYLKRPGKMRWQYHPPTPIVLVSNGKTITYYDAELDQVNYIPIDDTLAGFLARDVIKLNSDSIMLTHFESKDAVIKATVIQKERPDEGALTMEFSDRPLQIRNMVIEDASGSQTRIQLQNAKFGLPLPDAVFKFEDPRGIVPRRRHNR